VIEGFIAQLGKRAALNIAHISPRDLKSFRDAQTKEGKAGRTANLAVKIIGGTFNAARRKGLIQSNPAEALEALPHRAETKGVFSKTFAGIMEKASIKGDAARPRKGGKGRSVSKLSFHSFRHGFNSAMANQGIPQEIRQLLTGHPSAEMNKNYAHHELAPLRYAVKVIPSIKVK